MDKQILMRSQELLKRIDTLRESIVKSEQALKHMEDCGVRAIEFNSDWSDTTYLKDCHLDDGQQGLVHQLFTSVLKNRIEEAEIELAGILGPQEEEPLPVMDPIEYNITHAKRRSGGYGR